MDEDQQRYRSHLFTVRVWLEDLGGGQTEWRGKVDYIPSGEVRYFREWSTLVPVLLEMLPKDDGEMSDNCTELRKLNQDTFDAEDQKKIGDDDWEEFLRNVLGAEFTIRRSGLTVPDQNLEQMIEWIKEHPVAKRNLLDVVSWCDETLGVVTCPVTMMRDDNKLHRYQNIKVFKKQPRGQWQCVYWQVTEAPTQ